MRIPKDLNERYERLAEESSRAFQSLHLRDVAVHTLLVTRANDLDFKRLAPDLAERAVGADTPAPPAARTLELLAAMDSPRVLAPVQVLVNPRENHQALLLGNLVQAFGGAAGELDPVAHSADMAMRMTSSIG